MLERRPADRHSATTVRRDDGRRSAEGGRRHLVTAAGMTCPERVISPVLAKPPRAVRPVNVETIPAAGPVPDGGGWPRPRTARPTGRRAGRRSRRGTRLREWERAPRTAPRGRRPFVQAMERVEDGPGITEADAARLRGNASEPVVIATRGHRLGRVLEAGADGEATGPSSTPRHTPSTRRSSRPGKPTSSSSPAASDGRPPCDRDHDRLGPPSPEARRGRAERRAREPPCQRRGARGDPPVRGRVVPRDPAPPDRPPALVHARHDGTRVRAAAQEMQLLEEWIRTVRNNGR